MVCKMSSYVHRRRGGLIVNKFDLIRSRRRTIVKQESYFFFFGLSGASVGYFEVENFRFGLSVSGEFGFIIRDGLYWACTMLI